MLTQTVKPSPVVSAMNSYKETLEKMPGVTGVTAAEDGMHIATRSERDSKFLDSLLEDSINGVAIHFDAAPAAPKKPQAPKHKHPGSKPKKPSQPKPELSASEKIAKRYGKALSMIPHVTGITPDVAGDRLMVHVDDKASIGFVDNLVEDSLNGIIVQFDVAPPPVAG